MYIELKEIKSYNTSNVVNSTVSRLCYKTPIKIRNKRSSEQNVIVLFDISLTRTLLVCFVSTILTSEALCFVVNVEKNGYFNNDSTQKLFLNRKLNSTETIFSVKKLSSVPNPIISLYKFFLFLKFN